MNIKTILSRYRQHIIVALLAIGVFCFWLFLYPFIPVMREASLLFLWNTDYMMERLAIPGGLAQYLGEGVTQLFLNPVNAAIIYAILFVAALLLSKKLLRQFFPKLKSKYRFVLTLIPPIILWRVAMLPHIPLTPTMAVLLVMGAGCAVMSISSKRTRLIVLCATIPVMYWLTGPAAILLIVCCIRWIPLTAALFAASLIGSSYLVPYPLEQVVKGIDYDWSGVKEMGTYEEMECDMLIRQQRWDKILQKYQTPVSPAVRSAVIVASYKTGRINYQQLMSTLVVPVERFESTPSVFCIDDKHFIVYFGSVSSAFIVSDLASLLCWPNIAQRAAFEAMEYIPNHNKSARTLKQLAEISIITEQYALARKYLNILEETTFYSSWAHEMQSLVDNPQLIEKYPFMKKSREQYENTEDIFFI
ncbi:MAG: hypothetical protein J5797_05510 [Prevotella sp.]|nr:hypothetical protein [Prevotella sp.]